MPKDERDLETVGGFRQTMEKLGHKTHTRIISKVIRKAGEYYGDILKISPEACIYYIKRVCYSDGEPYSLEELYIPTDVVENLFQIDLDLFSMYQIYGLNGITVTRVHQFLELDELDRSDANLLDIKDTPTVMKFRGVSYDQHGRAVEYARTYTRVDKCNFTVHYTRKED